MEIQMMSNLLQNKLIMTYVYPTKIRTSCSCSVVVAIGFENFHNVLFGFVRGTFICMVENY